MMKHHSSFRRLGLATLAGALLLASCGDSKADEAAAAPADSVDSAATTEAPVTPAGGTTLGDPATGKPSVQLPAELPTELVVTDLVEGTGDPVELGDTVTLNYVGVLTAGGTEFDNNYDSGQPIQLTVGSTGVIPGFEQGLIGVRQGGLRQMDIPPLLAYGDTGAGDIIKPGAAVTFVVEIISVTKPVPVSIPPMADPSECPATDGSQPKQQEFTEYPPFCIDVTKTYTADIVSNFGNFSIELFPEKAPLTVNSFVTLAWSHYFDDTVCHRAIPGFVVQCGDPTATGTGGPGYQFPDELPAAGEYKIGSIAMANSGPNTNGSQFFIITGPNGAALPPQYSLFGQVSSGLESTILEMDGVANPDNNGVPPLDTIKIESVTIVVK